MMKSLITICALLMTTVPAESYCRISTTSTENTISIRNFYTTGDPVSDLCAYEAFGYRYMIEYFFTPNNEKDPADRFEITGSDMLLFSETEGSIGEGKKTTITITLKPIY